MATFSATAPTPPPPSVPMTDAAGRPTRAWVEYFTKLKAFLDAVAAALVTLTTE